MPSCATAVQQTDGSYAIKLDPSNTNLSTCSYVLETGQESQIGSILAMSPDDASQISMGIAVIWSIAWAWRMISNAITDGASDEPQ